MDKSASLSAAKESWVAFQTNQGLEIRATPLKLTRHLIVFEVYTPNLVLQMSEVLAEFKIRVEDRLLYSGRAVVSSVIHTGSGIVCEATLEESWLDLDWFSSRDQNQVLQTRFEEFIDASHKAFQVLPDFKIVVADMQNLLMDLRRWLEQVELGVRSCPSGDRQQIERETVQALQRPIVPLLHGLFERFEAACAKVEPHLQPAHRTYVKRQLHPLVLCAPFMYRTFQKPLGYAGDYEMVNMMIRDPCEGGSVFAKILNIYFLDTAPVIAHRNRIVSLRQMLAEETCRAIRSNRPARIFNLGCGPAQEVQDFLSQSDLSQQAQFTLVDFNTETLTHLDTVLSEIKRRHQRTAPVQLIKKSVAQLLKEAAKPASAYALQDHDFVYCAGLFDYLPDHVCRRLMDVLYEMLIPGGLLVVTNVHPSNPNRSWMEYSVDWNLFYRDDRQLLSLGPRGAPADACCALAEPSGVNVFLRVRKPEDA